MQYSGPQPKKLSCTCMISKPIVSYICTGKQKKEPSFSASALSVFSMCCGNEPQQIGNCFQIHAVPLMTIQSR